MAKYECLSCGGKLNRGNGEKWYCEDCGEGFFVVDGEVCGIIDIFGNNNIDYEDDYDDIWGEDDRPIGCRACDSDTWPACKEGCGMFDD